MTVHFMKLLQANSQKSINIKLYVNKSLKYSMEYCEKKHKRL